MEDAQDAGDFSSWLAEVRGAIAGNHGVVVPCGGCTACCTSSQFIAIGSDEVATLGRIPAELLFPAPRRPDQWVLGYDEQGHCPMLVGGRCSIYEDRPLACRTYDCRVFAAAGVEVDNPIGRQARRWRFRFPDRDDRRRRDAVRAAATSLGDAASPTERAVRAVQLHEQFLGGESDAG